MQKVVTPKLIVVIGVTLFCLYLTFPTFRYFWHVSSMDDPPTPAQIERRNELLSNKGTITLGLDLQGGASFVLQVEKDRLLRRILDNDASRLRNYFQDGEIDASVRVVDNGAGTDTAGEDMSVMVKLNRPEDLDITVTDVQSFLEGDVSIAAQGDVRSQLHDGELVLAPREDIINRRMRDSTDAALDVLKRRVDEFGLTQPVITRAGVDRIAVEIPGADNPDEIREKLLKTAALEFRLLNPQHDSLIRDFVQGGFVEGAGTGRIKPEFIESTTIPGTNRTAIKLKDDIPGVPRGYVLRLGTMKHIDPSSGLVDESKTINDLVYMVQDTVPLGGDHLSRANVITDPSDFENPIKVSIEFDAEGAVSLLDITESHVEERFAIILDDVVYSAPTIKAELRNGQAVITGGFSQAEASDLSKVLRAGALPAPLKVVSADVIGPSLGADSIRDSGRALMIGAVLIVIMMVAIYSSSGVVAVLAMFLNVLLILAVLSMLGATLTLSGIGGILLTMGMAVDANILIYERLREEIAAGKPLRVAVNQGFARAFSVILDSNVTSLVPALVLVLFEVVDGSVKGFWTAIGIGLLANLYTGLVVTRALMEAWYAKFKSISLGKIHLMANAKIEWMKYRIGGLIFSGSLVGASIIYLAVFGLSLGVDFTGGVQSLVHVPNAQNGDKAVIHSVLDPMYNDVKVIKVVSKDEWQITVPQTADRETGVTPTNEQIEATVAKTVDAAFPDRQVEVLSSQSLSPAIGGEFAVTAVWTVIIVCAIILAYVAWRFQWIFGLAAILALLHDVFIAFGVFKMLGHTLTIDIVSALLIILGYSVNDTIVVFDRIREQMQDRLTATLEDVIDKAINETLSRTLLTSGSTLLAVGVMYFFGGAGLADFALILLLGIAIGTYSSIFVASALVYTYLHRTGRTTVIAAKKATTRVSVQKMQLPKAKT